MLRTLKAELKAALLAASDAGKPLLRNVRFVMVYVAEAHAEDEWPISSARYNAGRGPVRVTQPRTGAERRALAERFQRDFDPAGDVFDDVLVDDVEAGDEFERAFAPWPFRFFGVSSRGVHYGQTVRSGGDLRVLEYVAHPRAASYDLEELRNWVLQLD